VPELTVTLADGRHVHYVEAGDPDGVPCFVHHGTPGAAVLDPGWVSDAQQRGLRLVMHTRPGYATSTRRPGRSVSDVVEDVVALADHLGITRFLTWGHSGGGPHALACAALLPDRVVAAAALASPAPYDADGLDFMEGMGEGNIEEFTLTVEGGEDAIRPLTEAQAKGMLTATVEQLAEEMAPYLTDVDAAEIRGPFGQTLHRSAMKGLADSSDGWVDDNLMFVRPWGFDPADIVAPVLLWQGRHDAMVPFGHGEWLARRIPGVDARLSEEDGHLTLVTSRLPSVQAWLRERWDAAV
jgi:pimeloyl-ACP methyl ester carboxylesterase